MKCHFKAASQAYEDYIIRSYVIQARLNKMGCFHVNAAQAVDLTYACIGSSVTVRYFIPLLSMCRHTANFSSEGVHALMFCSAEMKNTCMVLLIMCAHYNGISVSITCMHAFGHCIHL